MRHAERIFSFKLHGYMNVTVAYIVDRYGSLLVGATGGMTGGEGTVLKWHVDSDAYTNLRKLEEVALKVARMTARVAQSDGEGMPGQGYVPDRFHRFLTYNKYEGMGQGDMYKEYLRYLKREGLIGKPEDKGAAWLM